MSEVMSEAIRVIVRGRVQGVGFRFYTEQVARRLGVSGWVRNLPRGEVEVHARVAPEVRERFLAALRRGPPMARVDALHVEPLDPAETLPPRGFRVLH
jgi:acylphosphatase